MCFILDSAIASLNDIHLKLLDQLLNQRKNTPSTVNLHIDKAWITIDMLMTTWKSNFVDKLKQEFFLVVDMSVLPYGCTIFA